MFGYRLPYTGPGRAGRSAPRNQIRLADLAAAQHGRLLGHRALALLSACTSSAGVEVGVRWPLAVRLQLPRLELRDAARGEIPSSRIASWSRPELCCSCPVCLGWPSRAAEHPQPDYVSLVSSSKSPVAALSHAAPSK
jgi:hypothetical protein